MVHLHPHVDSLIYSLIGLGYVLVAQAPPLLGSHIHPSLLKSLMLNQSCPENILESISILG